VELDQVTDARLFERRHTCAPVECAVSSEALELVRVHRDVSDFATVLEQRFTDEEGRDRKAEADLERSPGVLASHPFAQRRALGWADRDRRKPPGGEASLPDIADTLRPQHHRER
jgi:hypothetical protein